MNVKNSAIDLSEFHARRESILGMLKNCHENLTKLGLEEWCSTLDQVEARLHRESFRILVIGEFKRGKSTFINALIGEEVLPAFPTPCTAIINELKWGETASATLHFKDLVPTPLPSTLDADAKKHIDRFSDGVVAPMQVEANELEKFVVIPSTGTAKVATTPFDYAEIFWPLDLLKDGVEIIDSPGLNEHGSRSKITMDYLGKVDAVLFVLSVHALASETELAVIDNSIAASGYNEMFFICNRFDELRRASDREKVMSHAYEQLASRSVFGKEGVFFISAIDAVIGREENDEASLERSGIVPLEKAISRFLLDERGRIKLRQPIRQLNTAVRSALNESIPSQRSMLECDMADFQKRYDAAQPQLKKATKNRDHVVRQLEKVADRMWSMVNDAAQLHLRSLVEEIPFWAEQIDLDSKINALKLWSIEAQIESVKAELVQGVAAKAEESTSSWQANRLRPMVKDHLEDFAEVAETQIEDFMDDVRLIREQLTGIDRDALGSETAGTAERVLSGLGGLVFGGAGSAIEGAVGGYDGMLRSLLPQIALAVGAVLVLHLNPVTVVPALIGLGIFRSFRKGDALTKKVKRHIGQEMSKLLAAGSAEICAKISDQVRSQTLEQIEKIQTALDREILTIREEVEGIYKAKKAGEAEIKNKLGRLAVIESNLRKIDEELQSL